MFEFKHHLKFLAAFLFLVMNIPSSFAAYDSESPELVAQAKKNLDVAISQFGSNAKSTNEHLKEELLDQQACIRAFKLFARYPAFSKAFYEEAYTRERLDKTLKSIGLERHSDVLNLISRLSRLVIFFDFHDVGAVAHLNGVNCDTSLWVRIRVSEKVSLDAHSFELRKLMLERFSNHIEFPVDGLSDGFRHGHIKRFLQESYELYGHTKFRSEIDKKVKKIVRDIEREIPKGAPTYSPEGSQELARRVLDLTAMLKP